MRSSIMRVGLMLLAVTSFFISLTIVCSVVYYSGMNKQGMGNIFLFCVIALTVIVLSLFIRFKNYMQFRYALSQSQKGV